MKYPRMDLEIKEFLPTQVTLFVLLILVPILGGTIDYVTALLVGYTFFIARFILAMVFVVPSELFYSRGNPIKISSAVVLTLLITLLPWWFGVIFIGILLLISLFGDRHGS